MKQSNLYIIVGFLGSGKTTFLKHIASLYSNQKIAIIINEFGDQNLDSKTLEKHFSHNYEVTGGSIFCSCKSDQFIEKIIDCSNKNFEYIFVEGSGLANPSSLPHIMSIINQKTNNKILHKGTITLVDPFIIEKITETLNAAKNQLTYADLILLNKIDNSTEETIQKATNIIKEFNPTSPIIPTMYANIPKQLIEDITLQTHKSNYLQTIDMHLQKITISFPEQSKQAITKFCHELAQYSDRIKGIITNNNKTYYVDYIDDHLHLEEISHPKENFIICLSTSKENLKNNIKKTLEKKQTQFSVCSLS